MTGRSAAVELGKTGGVILRDELGAYYAIPRRSLVRYRASLPDRQMLEAFLNGADSAKQPNAPDWTARTSRRTNDLWLVSA